MSEVAFAAATSIGLLLVAAAQWRTAESLKRLEVARSEPRFSISTSSDDFIAPDWAGRWIGEVRISVGSGVAVIEQANPAQLVMLSYRDKIDKNSPVSKCRLLISNYYVDRGGILNRSRVADTYLALNRPGFSDWRIAFVPAEIAFDIQYLDVFGDRRSSRLIHSSAGTRPVTDEQYQRDTAGMAQVEFPAEGVSEIIATPPNEECNAAINGLKNYSVEEWSDPKSKTNQALNARAKQIIGSTEQSRR